MWVLGITSHTKDVKFDLNLGYRIRYLFVVFVFKNQLMGLS